ncbi:MAG: hypothetical protein ACRD5Z_10185 [Bryobacteraceae bacterium]
MTQIIPVGQWTARRRNPPSAAVRPIRQLRKVEEQMREPLAEDISIERWLEWWQCSALRKQPPAGKEL